MLMRRLNPETKPALPSSHQDVGLLGHATRAAVTVERDLVERGDRHAGDLDSFDFAETIERDQGDPRTAYPLRAGREPDCPGGGSHVGDLEHGPRLTRAGRVKVGSGVAGQRVLNASRSQPVSDDWGLSAAMPGGRRAASGRRGA